jgi:hypothetical protein
MDERRAPGAIRVRLGQQCAAISKDDAPALSQAQFDRAKFRIGKKNVGRTEWHKAIRGRIAKQRSAAH